VHQRACSTGSQSCRVSTRIWAARQVRETLEPLLDKNRPAWMADLSLHTFTLGDTPPHVSAVKARRRCMHGARGRWSSACSFTL